MMRSSMLLFAALLWGGLIVTTLQAAPPEDAGVQAGPAPTADGFFGIWYGISSPREEYKFKYSGGLGTYPQQHAPLAIYRPEVNKTFFVYGGTTARTPEDKHLLQHMVSYFDHETREVARPRILVQRETNDAHDNPVLSIDDQGHLWVFSPSHGPVRPTYFHRSVRPYDITEFERLDAEYFSYPSAWHLPDQGFLLIHTRYGGKGLKTKADRTMAWTASADGRTWSEAEAMAALDYGSYQISWPFPDGRGVGMAFDHHPKPRGLDSRANIYYLQTTDGGKTWTNVQGDPVTLPFVEVNNPALVLDTVAEGKLAYLKDINYDADGRPVILFMTSGGPDPGPDNDPREWQTLRWTGSEWDRRTITASGNNYDHGSLFIEPDGVWRIIGPTEAGPQPGNTGGEVAMWISEDQSATWRRVKTLTHDSKVNHTYVRRPLNAHPDFYAFWADGHGREASASSFYFTDKEGTQVWRLPHKMDSETAPVEKAW